MIRGEAGGSQVYHLHLTPVMAACESDPGGGLHRTWSELVDVIFSSTVDRPFRYQPCPSQLSVLELLDITGPQVLAPWPLTHSSLP